MTFNKIFQLIPVLTILTFYSCKSSEVNSSDQLQTPDKKTDPHQVMIPHPPVIIYKTSNDYYKNVPVTLTADKSAILSYPDIADVFYQGELAYPIILRNGYLLDNRGIAINSAFIKYTYEEYRKLSATPSPEIIFDMIIDIDPFVEIYQLYCKRDTSEINTIIANGLNEKCKKIK